MNDDHPVTQGELKVALAEQSENLTSAMRQIETNLLTAFHSYARGFASRIRSGDTVDSELKMRMDALEERVMTLEGRLPTP